MEGVRRGRGSGGRRWEEGAATSLSQPDRRPVTYLVVAIQHAGGQFLWTQPAAFVVEYVLIVFVDAGFDRGA